MSISTQCGDMIALLDGGSWALRRCLFVCGVTLFGVLVGPEDRVKVPKVVCLRRNGAVVVVEVVVPTIANIARAKSVHGTRPPGEWWASPWVTIVYRIYHCVRVLAPSSAAKLQSGNNCCSIRENDKYIHKFKQITPTRESDPTVFWTHLDMFSAVLE